MAVTRRGLILAAGSAAAGCAARPTSGDTYPLWQIGKDGVSIFLMGDRGLPVDPWRSPRIEAAFSECTVFWKEWPGGEPSDVTRLTNRGLSPNQRLSSRLTPKQEEKVRAAAAKTGQPFRMLEGAQPWLALMLLNLAEANPLAPIGPSLQVTLVVAAEKAGTSMRSEFATVDALTDWLVEMPADAQIEYLMSTCDRILEGEASQQNPQRAWACGRLDEEEVRVVAMMRTYPAFYEAFVASRNRRWLQRFDEMLAGKQTTFVLVEALHLVGQQGVLALLKQAGMPVQRI